MRKIAKICDRLEGYTKLSELDGQNYNVWINENIKEELIEDLSKDIQYKSISFKGHALNMDLEKHYECDSLSEFEYENIAVYKAIEYLQEDVHQYLIDDGDTRDFAEIIIDKIILKCKNTFNINF